MVSVSLCGDRESLWVCELCSEAKLSSLWNLEFLKIPALPERGSRFGNGSSLLAGGWERKSAFSAVCST